MGCDIHSFVEVGVEGPWEHCDWKVFPCPYDPEGISSPFDWRCYRMFSFLADVRNSAPGDKWYVTPITSTSRGVPDDISEYVFEYFERRMGLIHSISYVYLSELLDYGYSEKLVEQLGELYFRDLEILKSFGPPESVRIVFGFDS